MSGPQERDEHQATVIVAAAYQRAKEIVKPAIADLVAQIELEITLANGSARAWTKLGHNVTGDAWVMRVGRLEAIHRLLTLVAQNEKAVAKAIREGVS